ncbi:histone H1-like [Leptopilina boulardi]|uniref:histone H1-like n=1 Tax=Leptopilina boulardi TaxID=63433 RepID=UPI0021F647A2|nr:histone H1-like [Leptopilina boulardi]
MAADTISVKSPKKTTTPASKSKKSSHPPSSKMVNSAIFNLKERSGSSLQSIKKYIAATYTINIKRQAPFINKYLKSAVANGSLIQTKGKGASGSFKLSDESKLQMKKLKVDVSPKLKKPVAEKKTSKIVVKPPKAKSASQMKVSVSPKKTKVPKEIATKPKKIAAKK